MRSGGEVRALAGERSHSRAGKTGGFVGGGRAATILLGGLAKADRLPERVIVSDPDEAVLARLKARHPSLETVSDNALAAQQDLVFLAVHRR